MGRKKRRKNATFDALAYPTDLASRVLEFIQTQIDGGGAMVAATCHSLMEADGEYVLASMITGFSLDDLKKADPNLLSFKTELKASFKQNPSYLLKLVSMVSKASKELGLSGGEDAEMVKKAVTSNPIIKQLFPSIV